MTSTLSRLAGLHRLRTGARLLFCDRYLLLTNTGVTLGLSATGDLIQQRYEILRGRQQRWDAIRTRNILLSALVVCPGVHYWYIYLDRFFPGRTFRVVMQKVFIDQMIMSPVCILSFLGITGLLEGMSLGNMGRDVRTKGLALLKAEWIVWPPAQTIQFWLLPTRYRVLYDNLVCLGVDIYYYFVKYSRAWCGNQSSDSSTSSEEMGDNVASSQSCDTRQDRSLRRNEKRLYICHAFFM